MARPSTKQEIIISLFQQLIYPEIKHSVTAEVNDFNYEEWVYLQSDEARKRQLIAYRKLTNRDIGDPLDLSLEEERALWQAFFYHIENGASFLART